MNGNSTIENIRLFDFSFRLHAMNSPTLNKKNYFFYKIKSYKFISLVNERIK